MKNGRQANHRHTSCIKGADGGRMLKGRKGLEATHHHTIIIVGNNDALLVYFSCIYYVLFCNYNLPLCLTINVGHSLASLSVAHYFLLGMRPSNQVIKCTPLLLYTI